MPGIGRDLLDLPFAELVRNLAVAIADGQTALDRNSLETLKALVDEKVDLITELTEIIQPAARTVRVGGVPITVTGAEVISTGAPLQEMSMFQAGLTPTFYQFTEAAIEVKLSITMKEDRDAQSAHRSSGFPWLGLGASRAYASSVDYRSASKYNYEATGSSVLRATLRPVPPPARLEPTVTTINNFSSPPVVTRTPA
jgi:hypothetical protein